MNQKCYFCHSSDIRKNGIRNNIQRYKCNDCNKTFTLKKKLNLINIWNDYSIGKQIYKQLAEKYHYSIRTIQRYLEKSPKTALNPPLSRDLNIIANTTLFSYEFGIFYSSFTLYKIYNKT